MDYAYMDYIRRICLQLVGVWYVTAGIGTESYHPHLRSAVIKRTATDDPKVLTSEVYVNLVYAITEQMH